eukprot:365924-Chlamydomonas_euryale.AAC.6
MGLLTGTRRRGRCAVERAPSRQPWRHGVAVAAAAGGWRQAPPRATPLTPTRPAARHPAPGSRLRSQRLPRLPPRPAPDAAAPESSPGLAEGLPGLREPAGGLAAPGLGQSLSVRGLSHPDETVRVSTPSALACVAASGERSAGRVGRWEHWRPGGGRGNVACVAASRERSAGRVGRWEHWRGRGGVETLPA